MCPGATPSRPRFRLRPSQRLRSRADFRRVFDCRCAASSPLLTVHMCLNGLSVTRIGISVSRRVGGAVIRNRLKRLIREAFRQTQHDLPAGLDIVCVVKAKRDPRLADYLELLPTLVGRAVTRLPRGTK